MIHFAPEIAAGMMELVDMRDLGSRGEIRWGSSPHARTSSETALLARVPAGRRGPFAGRAVSSRSRRTRFAGLRRGSDAFLSGTKQKAPVSRRLSSAVLRLFTGICGLRILIGI